MRIVAGVLIIVVAIFNLFGGLGYTLFGGAAAGLGAAAEAAAKKAGEMGDDKGKKEIETARAEIEKGTQNIRLAGGALMGFGVFLLVMAGLAVAAGVVLFMKKAAMFATVVGFLQVVADGISCWNLSHVGPTNILAIVAGLFVIVAGLSYRNQSAAPQM